MYQYNNTAIYKYSIIKIFIIILCSLFYYELYNYITINNTLFFNYKHLFMCPIRRLNVHYVFNNVRTCIRYIVFNHLRNITLY